MWDRHPPDPPLFTCTDAIERSLLEKIKSIPNAHAWVNKKYVKIENIKDAFEYWRWTVEIDESTNDIVDIYFNGEKLGDDYVFFQAIAPFVEADSYIQMLGEESNMWRWYFDGNTCIDQQPTITWS